MKSKKKQIPRSTRFKKVKYQYNHHNKTKKKEIIKTKILFSTSTNLNNIQYPIPLFKNSQSVESIIEIKQKNNFKIIPNISISGRKISKKNNTNILKYNYTSNDFNIIYKINELRPSLIYYIQEEYILQKQNNNSKNNFFTNWNKNNTKFFNDFINHTMPYFDAKYELANKYNYFIKYIYPVEIYYDINKNILYDIIKELNNYSKNKDVILNINIYSPYMDEGNILHSFLQIQNKFKNKINIHFKGCTLSKTCFDGFNNLMNLFNIDKKTISKLKYNDNYIQNSFKNNYDLYYGELLNQNITPKSIDIIETVLPFWDKLIDKQNNSLSIKSPSKQSDYYIYNNLNNFVNILKLLKVGGYIIIFLENLTYEIINLLNNIIHINDNKHFNVDFSMQFIRNIRITKFKELDDHDNYIFIFKKK